MMMDTKMITITIDGTEYKFALTAPGLIQFTKDSEEPIVFRPDGEVDDDEEGIYASGIEDGDSDEVARIRAWLFYNAPYLEEGGLDNPSILALMDEAVLHLLGLLPNLPPPANLTINDWVVSRGSKQFDIPSTGTEVLNYNPRAVYAQLVA